jgi:hypothetical protein
MKKTLKELTLCGLLGAATIAGTPNDAYAQNKPEPIQETNKTTTAPEEYTFKLVQYAIKEGEKIDISKFGKLMQTDIRIGNNDGKPIIEKMKLYDYDGDGRPDAIVFKKGDEMSLGLDYGSKHFQELRTKLGEKVELFKPYK